MFDLLHVLSTAEKGLVSTDFQFIGIKMKDNEQYATEALSWITWRNVRIIYSNCICFLQQQEG